MSGKQQEPVLSSKRARRVVSSQDQQEQEPEPVRSSKRMGLELENYCQSIVLFISIPEECLITSESDTLTKEQVFFYDDTRENIETARSHGYKNSYVRM